MSGRFTAWVDARIDRFAFGIGEAANRLFDRMMAVLGPSGMLPQPVVVERPPDKPAEESAPPRHLRVAEPGEEEA